MTREQYDRYTILELRTILAGLGGAPANKKKSVLIDEIKRIRDDGEDPVRSKRGRPSVRKTHAEDLLATLNDDIYYRVSDRNTGEEAIIVPVVGILDVNSGCSFLRKLDCTAAAIDTRVSQKFINEDFLISGDKIIGMAKNEPKRFMELVSIQAVNDAEKRTKPAPKFSSLEIFPLLERFNYSDYNSDLAAIDIIYPMAKGQRSLLTVPENCDRLGFMTDLARCYLESGAKVVYLGVDYKAEDVAQVKYSLGPKAEVDCLTFDTSLEELICSVNTVFKRVESLAISGHDVFLVVDSLYQLVKAYKEYEEEKRGTPCPLEKAVLAVKKLLSVSRNLGDNYISLLAVCPMPSDESTHADCQKIIKGIKDMCSASLVFDAKLNRKRIYPPINLDQSYCENFDRFLTEKDLACYDVIAEYLEDDSARYEDVLKTLKKYGKSDRLYERLKELLSARD